MNVIVQKANIASPGGSSQQYSMSLFTLLTTARLFIKRSTGTSVRYCARLNTQLASNYDVPHSTVNDLDPLGHELWLYNDIGYYEDATTGPYGCDDFEHCGDDYQGEIDVTHCHTSHPVLFDSSSESHCHPHTIPDLYNEYNLPFLSPQPAHPGPSSPKSAVFSHSEDSSSSESQTWPHEFLSRLPSTDEPTEIPKSNPSTFEYCSRCPEKFSNIHELAQSTNERVTSSHLLTPTNGNLFVAGPTNVPAGSSQAPTRLDLNSILGYEDGYGAAVAGFPGKKSS
ncbi:hypothetical protein B0T10DRAFT_579720 [Thelonectria olida]|uniref:Uncharacterized protein n=1 Tax=Thelonectria olida TaxID=1576542 RepID=A0A9P9AM41_9HYPO|nr:hypothetical protein B0T10DRAFT_579720 [Thelonectria olida]